MIKPIKYYQINYKKISFAPKVNKKNIIEMP